MNLLFSYIKKTINFAFVSNSFVITKETIT